MTPLKTTLRGAIGILAGLGRDEITIDWTAIEGRTVAIKGDNGMGKSTVMNLGMTPWRVPPQLKGTLYDEFGSEGRRELEFEHGGSTYRSEIIIKQTAKTRSTSAYLYWHNGQPYVCADGTTSDGKSSTYDACLTELLGSQDLYYLSAFRAQGARKLGEHDDPKGLMRDLLALDDTANMRDQAKEVAKLINREFEREQGSVERVGDLAEQAATLELELEQMSASTIPTLRQRRADLQDALAVARSRYENEAAKEADTLELRQKRDELQKAIDEALAEQKRVAGEYDEQIAAERKRGDDRIAELNRQIERVVSDRQQQQAIIDRNQRLIGDAEAIRAAQEAIPGLAEEIGRLEDLNAAQAIVEADIQGLRAGVDAIDGDIRSLKQEGATAARDANELENRSAALKLVPCGSDLVSECPLAEDAREAAPKAEVALAEVERLRERWNQLARDRKEILAKIDALREQVDDTLPDTLANARRQMADARELAARAEGLAGAEVAIADAEEVLKILEGDKIDADNDMRNVRVFVTESIKTIEGRKGRATGVIGDRITRLRSDLATIQADLDGTGGSLQAAREALTRAETALEAVAGELEQAITRKASLTARAEETRERIAELEEVAKRAERLGTAVGKWRLLARLLQGIIDLTIEDAGPAIAATANRLLRDAYGPRFSVRIVTQREQANGKLVETFDISVLDSQTGIESSVLRKSGGESVWIDKALTDAVMIYHQDTSGQHYGTLFADEAEDGLTQERKLQFYRMDRAALEAGGFERKFFVSHNPDAWEMADGVLDLAGYVGGES